MTSTKNRVLGGDLIYFKQHLTTVLDFDHAKPDNPDFGVYLCQTVASAWEFGISVRVAMAIFDI